MQACVGSSGLEAVSKLVRLGSHVKSLESTQQEIPYTCGDTIDVVSLVGGDLEDTLKLQDCCPVPMQENNAVSIVVVTAQEILSLTRDSLQHACVEVAGSKEPLMSLGGRVPLQALLLAQRCNCTDKVERPLDTLQGRT